MLVGLYKYLVHGLELGHQGLEECVDAHLLVVGSLVGCHDLSTELSHLLEPSLNGKVPSLELILHMLFHPDHPVLHICSHVHHGLLSFHHRVEILLLDGEV